MGVWCRRMYLALRGHDALRRQSACLSLPPVMNRSKKTLEEIC